jgi:hypothetical protein
MRPWPSSALLIPAALACGLAAGIPALAARQSSAPVTPLPNGAGSFKFAVLGDSGTGEKGQHELAEQMASLRERFDYRTVLLLGGNIAGPERPQDFVSKFEVPYKRLLGQGVEFRAALGESDSREQRFYKPFNMGGQIYYTFSPAPDIQLFALETTYMEPAQMRWLESQLEASSSAWKIVFFHHSPYSSGRRHGSDVRLRNMLEPLFLRSNVSVVFSAHDNFYERITPQQGISYFVVGAGGKTRPGDLDRGGGLSAAGFDRDLSFLAAEIAAEEMRFNVISRTGEVVDSGRVPRRK